MYKRLVEIAVVYGSKVIHSLFISEHTYDISSSVVLKSEVVLLTAGKHLHGIVGVPMVTHGSQ